MLTRYADVRAALADSRLIRPLIEDWPPPAAERSGPDLITMMELNGPRHTALRKAVAEAFGVPVVRRRRERIRGLADQLLDAFADGDRPGDLIASFTEPFPLLVMCEMVGIPYDERRYFLPIELGMNSTTSVDEVRRAFKLARDYITKLISRKRRRPASDILSNLIHRRDAGELTNDDVIVFGISMLLAGFRSTTTFLTNAVLTLLTQPDQLTCLRADRAILPSAVEELLRYLPINLVVVLEVTEDLQLYGQTIRAGEALFPNMSSANRDETAFPRADRLDLRRERNPHLTFGRGPHNCLGAYLARVEMEVALEALLDRFPRLHLAVDERELFWNDESPAKAPLTLPVGW